MEIALDDSLEIGLETDAEESPSIRSHLVIRVQDRSTVPKDK